MHPHAHLYGVHPTSFIHSLPHTFTHAFPPCTQTGNNPCALHSLRLHLGRMSSVSGSKLKTELCVSQAWPGGEDPHLRQPAGMVPCPEDMHRCSERTGCPLVRGGRGAAWAGSPRPVPSRGEGLPWETHRRNRVGGLGEQVSSVKAFCFCTSQGAPGGTPQAWGHCRHPQPLLSLCSDACPCPMLTPSKEQVQTHLVVDHGQWSQVRTVPCVRENHSWSQVGASHGLGPVPFCSSAHSLPQKCPPGQHRLRRDS